MNDWLMTNAKSWESCNSKISCKGPQIKSMCHVLASEMGDIRSDMSST